MDPMLSTPMLPVSGANESQVENLRMMSLRPDNKMTDEQINEAADQFETMMLRMLLKQMRKTIPYDEGLFAEQQSTKMYHEIVDDHLAEELAKNNSMGIDKLIADELRERRGHQEHPQKDANGFMTLPNKQDQFIPLQSTEAFLKLREAPKYYDLDRGQNPFMPLNGRERVSSSNISNL